MKRTTKLAILEKKISDTMKGFHATIKVLEDTTEEYATCKAENQLDIDTLNNMNKVIDQKLVSNVTLLKNFKNLLGI